MNLAEALLPLLPGGTGAVAFVGAGGKTSALFRLAAEFAALGRRVLLTTTTQLADPRVVPAPGARVVFRPELETSGPGGAHPEPGPGVTLLLSREADEPGKVKGVHPSRVPALKAAWEVVLVEADGSRGLPVKAPAPYEPAIPPGTDLVIGVIGLDCLGWPMGSETVHRPERFAAVAGCPPGAPVEWAHLVSLARHPEGLFKEAPPGIPRAIVLNKIDAVRFRPSPASLAELRADLVWTGSLERGDGTVWPERGEGAACR